MATRNLTDRFKTMRIQEQSNKSNKSNKPISSENLSDIELGDSNYSKSDNLKLINGPLSDDVNVKSNKPNRPNNSNKPNKPTQTNQNPDLDKICNFNTSINAIIDKIKSSMQNLDLLQQKRLNVNFITDDDVQLEQKITEDTLSVVSQINACATYIQQFVIKTHKNKTNFEIYNSVITKNKTTLMNVMIDFNKMHLNFFKN